MKNYRTHITTIYLLIIILIYTIFFSVLTTLRHETLQTGIYDLGIYDQTLWNIIHRRFTLGHFSPILIFVAPLYWIWCSPKILLIFQSFSLAIGAVPIYLLAKRKLDNTKLSLSLSIAYLLSLHLHGVNFFDFHPLALGIPLILFAFYFIEIEKYILFFIFLIFYFMCREEMYLIGFMIGLYFAITKKNIKMGMYISISSLIALLIIGYIIIPYQSHLRFLSDYKYYNLANKTLCKIIGIIFMPHNKIKYILSLFLPVMGFPLISGWGLLLIIPQMFGVLLSCNRKLFTIGFYQYSAAIIPFIFILSVYGISKIKKTKPLINNLISVYLIALGIIFNFIWFSKYFKLKEYKITEHHRLINKIKKLIPQDASLMANNLIGAHLSQRREIYNFEDLAEWPDRVRNKTDYIVIDTKTLYPYAIDKLKEILSAKEYGIMYYEDGYIILKKGYNSRLNDKILASH